MTAAVKLLMQCSILLLQGVAAATAGTLERQIQNTTLLTQALKVGSRTDCTASVALSLLDNIGASMNRAVETTVADVDRNPAAETQDDNSLDE